MRQISLNDFQSVDELRDRGIGTDDTDNRDVARVLIEQIEFANVILLNKTDLVSKTTCGSVSGCAEETQSGCPSVGY